MMHHFCLAAAADPIYRKFLLPGARNQPLTAGLGGITLRTLPKRLASLKKDPWNAISSTRQSLRPALEKIRALAERD